MNITTKYSHVEEMTYTFSEYDVKVALLHYIRETFKVRINDDSTWSLFWDEVGEGNHLEAGVVKKFSQEIQPESVA